MDLEVVRRRAAADRGSMARPEHSRSAARLLGTSAKWCVGAETAVARAEVLGRQRLVTSEPARARTWLYTAVYDLGPRILPLHSISVSSMVRRKDALAAAQRQMTPG